jgi:hypothetical protein
MYLPLIAANLISFFLAFFLEWDLSALFLVYLLQAGIIGLFMIIKLLSHEELHQGKFRKSHIFDAILYGALFTAYLVMFYKILRLLSLIQHVPALTSFIIPAVLFFIAHYVLYRKERIYVSPRDMVAVLDRAWLHLYPLTGILLLGVVFFSFLHESTRAWTFFALFIFVLLKIVVDIYAQQNYFRHAFDTTKQV